MSTCFRSAVFGLCKKLSNCSEVQNVRNLIHRLCITTEKTNKDHREVLRPPHGDLAYIGSNQGLQFMGYLFADESVDEINRKGTFRVTALDDEERSLIERAHNTIRFFLDSCISGIVSLYPKSAILIDPYSQYRMPTLRFDAGTFLTNDDISECIEAFTSGKVYRRIVTNETLCYFEKIDTSIVRQLVAIQAKQFSDDMNSITIATKEFFQRAYSNNQIGTADICVLYASYCYALRKSLWLAIEMLYEAVLGVDMPVMNNDNIIRLVDHKDDIVYEKYTVLTQNILFGFAGRGVDSITLLTCNPSETHRIKEFGQVVAMTVSLVSEFGSTSRVTMITVDEELNPIHRYTNALMETRLGQCHVTFHDETIP